MKEVEIEVIKEFFTEILPYIVSSYQKKGEITVTTKRDATDFLTEVDLFVQNSFVKKVKKVFPEDIIIGEEAGFSQYEEDYNGRAWVIDPIDGTANFVRSYFPAFTVAIAFVNKGEVMCSGVLIPMTGDVFIAEKGKGAWQNGNKIGVSSKKKLNEACVHLDFGRKSSRETRLPLFLNPIISVGQIRCIGSAIFSLVQVAMGIADAYVHTSLQPWDFLAGKLLLEEAKGRVSQVDGSPVHLFSKNNGIIATNGHIHEELLAIINKPLKIFEIDSPNLG